MRKAAEWGQANRVELVSVGVDTWGVDWSLVDKAGELVGVPHAYRDPRNQAAYDAVMAKLGADRIYRTTGIQFMALNSLYSLYAHKTANPARWRRPISCCSFPICFTSGLAGSGQPRPRSHRPAR